MQHGLPLKIYEPSWTFEIIGLDTSLPDEVVVELKARLRYALHNRRVKWREKHEGQFNYLGYEYKVVDFSEEDMTITQIERIGKVMTDDDGNELYEDLSIAHKVKHNPGWGQW